MLPDFPKGGLRAPSAPPGYSISPDEVVSLE